MIKTSKFEDLKLSWRCPYKGWYQTSYKVGSEQKSGILNSSGYSYISDQIQIFKLWKIFKFVITQNFCISKFTINLTLFSRI